MALKIDNVIWQDHIIEKIHSKHGIEPAEVESALTNTDPNPHIWKAGRDRYAGIGQVSDSGEYLFVVFALPQSKTARVITARPATENEKSVFRRRKDGR
ncbi:MAG: BrnT family toxin [Armatimonadetes bacterium]|nr:BrnT family toxin [Armatimonadota bacterium]